jgi:hypothetical protein
MALLAGDSLTTDCNLIHRPVSSRCVTSDRTCRNQQCFLHCCGRHALRVCDVTAERGHVTPPHSKRLQLSPSNGERVYFSAAQQRSRRDSHGTENTALFIVA